ncbi:hypothetical protein Q763_09000 [Flavobacterium beibuense F44-8]|uniref:Pentapeptide repeat-containing protein n=1 Tax=Flavobacterium beibuense F44-8 TaxID=1406840 RepID=A0A0A2LMU6_9FLAO|nr:pentapeptide repeat-containing protein [Flavobacterium beibuense]KGO81209.1 hypothetical protein Q763_09000 [Flavobacterium beibuense F44-8]
MKEITGEEFIKLLKSNINTIENYSIIDEITINPLQVSSFNKVSKCYFKGSLKLMGNIKQKEPENLKNLIISDSIIEKSIVINRCSFELLKLEMIVCNDSIFSISECNLGDLDVNYLDVKSKQFSITHNTFKYKFKLNNVTALNASFILRHNTFNPKEKTFFRSCMIHDCTILNCDISNNDFGSDLRFTNNKLGLEDKYSNNSFKNCVFNSASFYETDFGYSTTFKECRFEESVLFEKLKNEITTKLEFTECLFKSSASFKKSRLNCITFKNCIFQSSSFFENSFFNLININNSVFEKTAFFDDIQIKKIYDCNRKTIRIIKFNLQKSENKIDYNKFRIYEFEAYKKDLIHYIKEYRKDQKLSHYRKREIKTFKRDLLILNITGLFSVYGTDWKRALKCTIIFGLFFYSLLYFIEFYVLLNLQGNSNFWIGAFRFFLLTDFYSPFLERQFLNNGFSWLILVLGKIIIAFGIYEMIQAFRKFKA